MKWHDVLFGVRDALPNYTNDFIQSFAVTVLRRKIKLFSGKEFWIYKPWISTTYDFVLYFFRKSTDYVHGKCQHKVLSTEKLFESKSNWDEK